MILENYLSNLYAYPNQIHIPLKLVRNISY
jgi:hypothetical protein